MAANNKPLSDQEREQLVELQRREALAAHAEAEATRLQKQEAFAPVARVLDVLDMDTLAPLLDEAIRANADPDTLSRILRVQSILTFDVGALRERRAALDELTPEPSPAPPAQDLPVE